MKYKIIVNDKFESAHRLVKHEGKCKNLHGHAWDVEVCLQVDERAVFKKPDKNMAIDFSEVKHYLSAIIFELDHKYLNEVLDTENPTAEYIARWIYEKFESYMKGKCFEDIILLYVAINETDKNRVEYHI